MDKKKYWFFGSKLNSVLLLVLIILMIFAIRIMLQNKETYLPFIYQNDEKYAHTTALEIGKGNQLNNANREQILGNKEDLVIFSVAPNTKVHGILSYIGVIKGGYFFEANILINILDANKKVLKNSNAMATSNWMTAESVDFEGSIDLKGLPKGPAYFEIKKDNPAAPEGVDKSILIPIIIN
ncbi:MAG: Gmad2 immunoglobulin-like domain-containing protein [Candidatus Paceibacterota bacterium]